MSDRSDCPYCHGDTWRLLRLPGGCGFVRCNHQPSAFDAKPETDRKTKASDPDRYSDRKTAATGEKEQV